MCVCMRLSLCASALRSRVVFFRRILGFPSEELQRGPVLQQLPEQLRQQTAYLHLIHWSGTFSWRLWAWVRAVAGPLS